MSLRISKGKGESVNRVTKGMFTKNPSTKQVKNERIKREMKIEVERVDWLMDSWVNRKMKKFNPKIHKRYPVISSHLTKEKTAKLAY